MAVEIDAVFILIVGVLGVDMGHHFVDLFPILLQYQFKGVGMEQFLLGLAVEARQRLVDIAKIELFVGDLHQFGHVFQDQVVLVLAQFQLADGLLLLFDDIFQTFQPFLQIAASLFHITLSFVHGEHLLFPLYHGKNKKSTAKKRLPAAGRRPQRKYAARRASFR